jgi:proline iminopeptidase
MLRRWELEWFYQNPHGCGALYPDLWDKYAAPIPPRERGDMIGAYYKRLTSRNPETVAKAARAWSVWEGSTAYLRHNAAAVAEFEDPLYAAAFARIECHYFVNKGFFDQDDQLLRNVRRIRKIPATIVHGRYDVICPVRNAWELAKVWPEAQLRIVPDAGHSAFEKGMIEALVAATDLYAR